MSGNVYCCILQHVSENTDTFLPLPALVFITNIIRGYN